MNTHVNFEIAKLLKEKGYDEKVFRQYSDKYGLHPVSKSIDVVIGPYEQLLKADDDCFAAPTIAEVVMWLYEKHGMWVYSYNNGTTWIGSIQANSGSIRKLIPANDSPTAAYEAAITHILKTNLI